MTSHYYAIADAAGTIYPGSFAQSAVLARWNFLVQRDRTPNLRYYGYPINYEEQEWPAHAACGDHVVYCTVETNETVKVTYERPCPWSGVAYSCVPGYVEGRGCPVCKAIGSDHLPVPNVIPCPPLTQRPHEHTD